MRLTKSKVTIVGQTAPGAGIGFKDGTFRISGDDVVARHVRFRFGDQAAGGDWLNLDSGSLNTVLDSISTQFSTDENMSSFGSPLGSVTLQWSQGTGFPKTDDHSSQVQAYSGLSHFLQMCVSSLMRKFFCFASAVVFACTTT